MNNIRRPRLRLQPGAWFGIAIVTFTLAIFMISRVHQVTDSSYSMLLSQSLLDHRSFALDHYTPAGLSARDDQRAHLLSFSSRHVGSLDSVCLVLNRLGVSAANADGTYNPRGEMMIEAGLAALLMAVLAGIFFFTARLLLPDRWSAVVALGGALGTQVYSTASRALWSETWGIFLLGIVVLLLLAHETGKRSLNPHPARNVAVVDLLCASNFRCAHRRDLNLFVSVSSATISSILGYRCGVVRSICFLFTVSLPPVPSELLLCKQAALQCFLDGARGKSDQSVAGIIGLRSSAHLRVLFADTFPKTHEPSAIGVAVAINLHCSSHCSLRFSALVGRSQLWSPIHDRPRSVVGAISDSRYSRDA